MTERLLRPLRFGIVGLFNTALGLGVIFAGKALGGLGDLAANAIGYAVGIAGSFALNRNWTFRHKGEIKRAFWRFVAVFGIAYVLNLATVFGLRDFAGLNAYVAQAIGIVPYTLFSYWASAHYAFSPKDKQATTNSERLLPTETRFPFVCPLCGAEMRIIAFLTDPVADARDPCAPRRTHRAAAHRAGPGPAAMESARCRAGQLRPQPAPEYEFDQRFAW